MLSVFKLRPFKGYFYRQDKLGNIYGKLTNISLTLRNFKRHKMKDDENLEGKALLDELHEDENSKDETRKQGNTLKGILSAFT